MAFDFLATDAATDLMILTALAQHPLRTPDAAQADFFLLPLSPAHVKLHYWQKHQQQQQSQQQKGQQQKGQPPNKHASTASPSDTHPEQAAFYDWFIRNWQQHPYHQQGHRHIIVSTWWGLFEHRLLRYAKFRSDALVAHYDDAFWNVTVAHVKNRRGIQQLFHAKPPRTDFQPWFAYERISLTRSQFSLGNIPPPHSVPFRPASYDRFRHAAHVWFYHVRNTTFWTRHSTDFRRAALQPHVRQQLPPSSSMGYGLPRDEWQRQFANAQFCLVVRGDDPNSHSLLRAVKVGCLPVVVSDALPWYAPTLPRSLHLSDYTIAIPEATFLQNPLAALLNVTQLSAPYLHDKMQALAWAQRVALPDHPHSLFVPAFLREAEYAMEQALLFHAARDYHHRQPATKPPSSS